MEIVEYVGETMAERGRAAKAARQRLMLCRQPWGGAASGPVPDLAGAFDLIELLGRENYVAAARSLACVKAIHLATGDTKQWESTIQATRQRYANRRALREELQRAHL